MAQHYIEVQVNLNAQMINQSAQQHGIKQVKKVTERAIKAAAKSWSRAIRSQVWFRRGDTLHLQMTGWVGDGNSVDSSLWTGFEIKSWKHSLVKDVIEAAAERAKESFLKVIRKL